MKGIVLRQPGGLDRLELVDMPDLGHPGPGEIRVRLHASSLNFHDYAVVTGMIPTADGRIPMSDGAGVVEAVGEGVSELKVGDHVVSCFFPGWQEGPPTVGDFVGLVGSHQSGRDVDLVFFVTDAAGQNGRRLTDHWGIDVSPVWSPDGRRIAFCSARSGGPQVYVMNADGSGVTRISHTGNYNTSPAWSPKGDRLAWTTRAGGIFQVVVASDDGSDARTITSQGSNENPTWGPDGRYLVFSSRRGGRSQLYFADRDGKTLKQLTRGPGDDTSPAWSPRL